jgi:hypothetical protein
MDDHWVKESIHSVMEGLLEYTTFKADPKSISVQITVTYPDEKLVMKKTVKAEELPDPRQVAMFGEEGR